MTVAELAVILLGMSGDAEVRIFHELTDYPVQDVTVEDGDGGIIVLISSGEL